MQNSNNIQSNLEKLADIRKKNPSATHIYIRRCDKDNLVVDIPMDHAEFTIRNRPMWEVVASNRQMDDAVEALFKEPVNNDTTTGTILEPPTDPEIVLPPKPSEEVKPVKPKKDVKPRKPRAKSKKK